MPCGDYAPGSGEYLDAGQFFDAIYCLFASVIPPVAFNLIVFGAIGLALFIYSDNVGLPVVVAILLGSVIVPQLPSVGMQIAVVALLLVSSIAATLLVKDRIGR